MKLITVYVVNQGDDDRYSGKPKWVFRTETQANSVAHGRGWYGGNAPTGPRKAILGDDGETVYLCDPSEPFRLNIGPEDEKQEKERLLKKLDDNFTDYEKKALGIKV